MVTGRDVYGPVVGYWLCNDNWMKLTVTPKGGVKMWHPMFGGITVSCQWLCMVLPVFGIYNNIYTMCGWFCSYCNKYRLWMMCFW